MPYPKIYLDELEEFTKWALIAFASRCARRALWDYSGAARADRLAEAVSRAENTAWTGQESPAARPPLKELRTALRESEEFRGRVEEPEAGEIEWDALSFQLVADCVVHALEAALSKTHKSLLAATFFNARSRTDIFDDFDLLSALS